MSKALNLKRKSGIGRPPQTINARVTGTLTEAQLRELDKEELRSVPKGPTPLKKVNDRHHLIALYMTRGLKDVEISYITGLTAARVRDLRRDPSFQTLLRHYRQGVKVEADALFERLNTMGLTALARLQEVLEDEEHPLAADALAGIVFKALDRLGHSPVAKSLTLNGQIPAEVAKEFKDALDSKERVIAVTQSEGAALGAAGERKSLAHRTLEGKSGGGSAVRTPGAGNSDGESSGGGDAA